jgi:prepilin-type processing-associated H-X9-DG protein
VRFGQETFTEPRSLGFTLIEILVVIAIIMVLVALLMPALRQARLRAMTVKCASHMRQLGIAFRLYASEYDGYYPGCNSRWRWLGAGDWVGSVPSPAYPTEGGPASLCGPDDSGLGRYVNPGNKPCKQTVFWCPADKQLTNQCSYVMNGGLTYGANGAPDGLLYTARTVQIPFPAQTFLLAEVDVFGDPRTGDPNNDNAFYCGPKCLTCDPTAFSSRHSGGLNVLYCDGHVSWQRPADVLADQIAGRGCAYDGRWGPSSTY